LGLAACGEAAIILFAFQRALMRGRLAAFCARPLLFLRKQDGCYS